MLDHSAFDNGIAGVFNGQNLSVTLYEVELHQNQEQPQPKQQPQQSQIQSCGGIGQANVNPFTYY